MIRPEPLSYVIPCHGHRHHPVSAKQQWRTEIVTTETTLIRRTGKFIHYLENQFKQNLKEYRNWVIITKAIAQEDIVCLGDRYIYIKDRYFTVIYGYEFEPSKKNLNCAIKLVIMVQVYTLTTFPRAQCSVHSFYILNHWVQWSDPMIHWWHTKILYLLIYLFVPSTPWHLFLNEEPSSETDKAELSG